MNFGPFSFLLILSSLISVPPMVYAFTKRKKHKSIAIMGFLLLSIIVWSLGSGLEHAALSLSLKRVFNFIAYIGIVSVPPLWFLFAFAYTETVKWINIKTTIYFFIVPVITLTMYLTNEYHFLFYEKYSLEIVGNYTIFATEVGPYWNYVHLIYSAILVISGYIIMISRLIKVHKKQQINVFQIIFATSLPIIGNILYVTGVRPYGYFDITPITFIVSGMIFIYGIMKHKLFDVVPFAMEQLYDSIPNEVFVFDKKGELISKNTQAEKAMSSKAFKEEFFSDDFIKSPFSTEKEMHFAGKDYLVSKTPLGVSNQNPEGYLLVLNDISKLKESQRTIDYINFHDHLTGLYNRRFYDYTLEKYDSPEYLPVSFISIDVNGLKLMNDAFGHSAGDELLRKTASILDEMSGENFIPVRLGGDEFFVILPKTSAEKVKELIRKINQKSVLQKINSISISLAIGSDTKDDINQNIRDVIENADIKMYNNKLRTKKSTRLKILDVVMAKLWDDYYDEKRHFENVARITREISICMGLERHKLTKAVNAALVHDIGKIRIPPEVLYSPAPLSGKERSLIMRHSDTGYQILKAIDDFVHLAEIVLYHHERWDGTGYPVGLKGEEIPLESRIIAIADAYDSITSDKPYMKAKSPEFAIEEILKNSGTQFDPEVVKVFIENFV